MINPRFTALALITLTGSIILTSLTAYADDAIGLSALKSGKHFAMMRHALAPGFGDPANFALTDCTTQRNLSPEGVKQAARIGDRLRAAGIDKARVVTSQWCRCMDTATSLGLGTPETLPAINSFFARTERKAAQMQALREWLGQQDLSQPLVLVSHQVNMTALTGNYPASGEIFIIERREDGTFGVVSKLQTE